MNPLVKVILIVFFPILTMAQDSVILISQSDFDNTSDQVFIATKDGGFSGRETIRPGQEKK